MHLVGHCFKLSLIILKGRDLHPARVVGAVMLSTEDLEIRSSSPGNHRVDQSYLEGTIKGRGQPNTGIVGQIRTIEKSVSRTFRGGV
jgi:hypothetical protein